jgi:hypothetical protein
MQEPLSLVCSTGSVAATDMPFDKLCNDAFNAIDLACFLLCRVVAFGIAP